MKHDITVLLVVLFVFKVLSDFENVAMDDPMFV